MQKTTNNENSRQITICYFGFIGKWASTGFGCRLAWGEAVLHGRVTYRGRYLHRQPTGRGRQKTTNTIPW